MAQFTAGALGVDFDALDLKPLALGTISGAGPTSFTVSVGPFVVTVRGVDLNYGVNGLPSAGRVTGLKSVYQGEMEYDLSGFSITATTFSKLVQGDPLTQTKAAVLSSGDSITGSSADDRLQGLDGDDTIMGGGGSDEIRGDAGNDRVFAGAGNDTIDGGSGSGYLRGEDGDDSMVGGAGFDDIQGNMGNDTESGGLGDDWVVGGKDNDLLFGDDGHDVLNGNLGNDTVQGGTGIDIVRGGRGDDSLSGGVGDDLMFGDRGSDSIRGGAGADRFYAGGDGTDIVFDFNAAEGDRIGIAAGATYSFAQVGADVVITLDASADKLILANVQMSSIPDSWVFPA